MVAPTTQTPPIESRRNPDDPFPADEFETIPDVPVFSEHETVTQDGRRLRFGPQELSAVANRCNQRIAETGDYAVVCLGHTPNKDAAQMGAAQPDTVGYAGPFRVGMYSAPGSNAKKYAILANFHIHKEDWPRARKHPRRSAELWMHDKYEDMFLDPIALLGAELPRLDLGLVYSRVGEKQVLKYSAAFPGASNVFVPAFADETKKFEAADEAGDNMLTPEDLQAVVDALTEMPQWQWINAQMQQDSGAPGTTQQTSDQTQEVPGEGPPAPPQPEPEKAMGDHPPMPTTMPTPTADAGEEPDQYKRRFYQALDDMSDDELEQYMAGRHKRKYDAESAKWGQSAADQEGGGSEDHLDDVSGGETSPKQYQSEDEDDERKKDYAYSGDSVKYQMATMQKNMATLQKKLDVERGRRVDAERTALVHHAIANGNPVDPQKVMERLCYSKVRSNEQFEQLFELVVAQSSRAPVLDSDRLPPGVGDRGAEKYSAIHPTNQNKKPDIGLTQIKKAFELSRQRALSGESNPSGLFHEELTKIQNGSSA